MPFSINWIERPFGPDQKITIYTPVAQLMLTVCQNVIVDADWKIDDRLPCVNNQGLQQLFDEYCRDSGQTVNLNLLRQGSVYRNRVWSELCNIPFGSTITYSGLAQKLGSSARAVGNACRDNPYPFIIPCHRVVSARGLGGYCGQTVGDLTVIKKKLLQWEMISGK